MRLEKVQTLTDAFVNGTYPLLTGPLKYRSRFAPIVEGTFRRDSLTLQTINFLSKTPQEYQLIFGNSCMDLARRTIEDMVCLEYMILEGKESMGKKFMNFKAIEAMLDLTYLKDVGVKVDPTLGKDILRDFEAVKKHYPDKRRKDGVRRNWVGVDVETMITKLLEAGVIKADESKTVVQTYQAGCYKNHFSPTDIHAFLKNTLFRFSNKADIEMSLLVTLSCVVKIANRLGEECEIDEITKAVVDKTWQTLKSAHKTHALE